MRFYKLVAEQRLNEILRERCADLFCVERLIRGSGTNFFCRASAQAYTYMMSWLRHLCDVISGHSILECSFCIISKRKCIHTRRDFHFIADFFMFCQYD